MTRASLIVAAGIVVAANAIALVHAFRNRMSPPDAEITLTEREITYFNYSSPDDDSGVEVRLQWTDPSLLAWPAQPESPSTWLNKEMLERLGFDCSISPSSPDASRSYQRQRPRQAFIALEYDGAAWKAWKDAFDVAVARQKNQSQNAGENVSRRSHLVAIDADLDPHRLRARNPDRTNVVILPAVISVGIDAQPAKSEPAGTLHIAGHVEEFPASIHVPRPFSEQFRRPWRTDAKFQLHLRFGTLLEPWVLGAEFQK